MPGRAERALESGHEASAPSDNTTRTSRARHVVSRDAWPTTLTRSVADAWIETRYCARSSSWPALPISSSISTLRATQSRQIATPGPATPSSDRPLAFPQNEHRKERSGAPSPARWGGGTRSGGIGSSLRRVAARSIDQRQPAGGFTGEPSSRLLLDRAQRGWGSCSEGRSR